MRRSLGVLFLAATVLLWVCPTRSAQAQVIERREGQSNPSVVIFRSTLFGAGTGLLLGSAVALVEDDKDLTTGELLKWGVAGGAAAGVLIGLVYVISRPEPTGSADEVGALHPGAGNSPRLGLPAIAVDTRLGPVGTRAREVRVSLLRVHM